MRAGIAGCTIPPDQVLFLLPGVHADGLHSAGKALARLKQVESAGEAGNELLRNTQESSRHWRANFIIIMNVVSCPARAASYVAYDIQWVRNDSISLQSAGVLLPAAGPAEHGAEAHGPAGLTRGASLKILSTS